MKITEILFTDNHKTRKISTAHSLLPSSRDCDIRRLSCWFL